MKQSEHLKGEVERIDVTGEPRLPEAVCLLG
jgi:hypothetical protein